MSTARWLFRGSLSLFLPKSRRGVSFEHPFARAATLKNAVESLGVPHTEVGAATVNGAPATLQRSVREGDEIEIFPWPPQAPDPERRFVADVHLGALARFLRMLGYDTLHSAALSDAQIRLAALEEARVVLTRDRELLKCADIPRGAYVRALKPEEQLREVDARYRLAAAARPFSRCLICNVPLRPVEKAEIVSALPPAVAEAQLRFTRCPGCLRVYWPGSHYARMVEVLGRTLEARIAP